MSGKKEWKSLSFFGLSTSVPKMESTIISTKDKVARQDIDTTSSCGITQTNRHPVGVGLVVGLGS